MTGSTDVDALALQLSLQLHLLLGSRAPLSPSARYTADHARYLALRFSPDYDAEWEGFAAHLQALNAEIDRYEDARLQQLALDAIPFDHLHDKASELQAASPELALQDALVHSLVTWAKTDFLKWADPIKCGRCASPCDAVGHARPSTVERRDGGASRVEVYRCPRADCHNHTERFPRYTRLEKLLQTRTGRCGEFAAIFMLLLRALSLRARYIWNSEDHVWNEYYSIDLQRWVHIDSCEGARDKHLLYDQGWGKQMKYCIAFGIDGARDVTQAYVADWQAALHRRHQSWEQRVSGTLAAYTSQRRERYSVTQVAQLAEEDARESSWLAKSAERAQSAKQVELEGRQSGTEAWRQARGETGTTSVIRPEGGKVIAFHSDTQLTVNGSAHLGPNGATVLTADLPDQVGSAWYQMPSQVDSLVVDFAFRVERDGADGMAFVLQADPAGANAIGQGGCQLGYGGISRSFAVEIDTYRSEDRCNDPPTPHLSVHTRGLQANDAHHRHSVWMCQSVPSLSNGILYSLKLCLFQRTQLHIYMTDSIGKGWVQLTDRAITVPDIWQYGTVYAGWTASTGGLHALHEVTTFEFYAT